LGERGVGGSVCVEALVAKNCMATRARGAAQVMYVLFPLLLYTPSEIYVDVVDDGISFGGVEEYGWLLVCCCG